MAQAVNASKNNPRDPRNREVVFPAGRDPQDGNLETPINASPLVKWYINNLPAYREGITPWRRGLEVGMAHGYFLIGPFAKLGPLRDTDAANLAGLLSTIGLVTILTACLSLYANSNPPQPIPTPTTPKPPDAFKSKANWNTYTSGFLIGGLGGAFTAYLLISNLPVLQGLLGR